MLSSTITSVPPAIGTTSGFAAASSSASSSDRGRSTSIGRWSVAEPSWVKSAAGPSPAVDDPFEREAVGRRHLRRPRTVPRHEDLATSPGSSRPSPTATSVPTSARTIWCRNAFARAVISIRSPSRAIDNRSSRRTVPPDCGRRQNDAKSCSPSSARAASRIGDTASAPGRCQTNRPSNGSGHAPVSIRYRYSRAVAENLALNPSGARRTSPATTSGASMLLIDRWSFSRSTSSRTTNDATCPRACTPASVRPATESFGASPKTRARASDRTPSTVRCPEFRAHPRNPDPSYASETRTITPGV